MSGLLQQPWLKGDDITDRFFRIHVEVGVERCLAAVGDPSAHNAAYAQIDAFSKLVLMLVRYFDDWKRSTTMTKETMLNKVGIFAHAH
jgi:hypothetical protein